MNEMLLNCDRYHEEIFENFDVVEVEVFENVTIYKHNAKHAWNSSLLHVTLNYLNLEKNLTQKLKCFVQNSF